MRGLSGVEGGGAEGRGVPGSAAPGVTLAAGAVPAATWSSRVAQLGHPKVPQPPFSDQHSVWYRTWQSGHSAVGSEAVMIHKQNAHVGPLDMQPLPLAQLPEPDCVTFSSAPPAES